MANQFPYLQGLGSALKSQQRSALYGGALQSGLSQIGESFGRGIGLGAERAYSEAEKTRQMGMKEAQEAKKWAMDTFREFPTLPEQERSQVQLIFEGKAKRSPELESAIARHKATEEASGQTIDQLMPYVADNPELMRRLVTGRVLNPSKVLQEQYLPAEAGIPMTVEQQLYGAQARTIGERGRRVAAKEGLETRGLEAEIAGKEFEASPERQQLLLKKLQSEIDENKAQAAKARSERMALSPTDPMKDYWKYEEQVKNANAAISNVQKQMAERGFTSPEAGKKALEAAQKTADRAQNALDTYLAKNPGIVREPEMAPPLAPPPQLSPEQRRDLMIQAWTIRGKSREEAERLANKQLGTPLSPAEQQKLQERILAIQMTEDVPLEQAVEMAKQEIEAEKHTSYGLTKRGLKMPEFPPGKTP